MNRNYGAVFKLHAFLCVIMSATGPINRFESPAAHPLILEESDVNIKHPILADELP